MVCFFVFCFLFLFFVFCFCLFSSPLSPSSSIGSPLLQRTSTSKMSSLVAVVADHTLTLEIVGAKSCKMSRLVAVVANGPHASGPRLRVALNSLTIPRQMSGLIAVVADISSRCSLILGAISSVMSKFLANIALWPGHLSLLLS